MTKTTLHQNIDKLRNEIEAVRDELKWLGSSPITHHELKARLEMEVHASQRDMESDRILRGLANPIRDQYSPSFGDLFRIETKVTHLGGTQPTVTPISVALGPLLVWLLGDELTKNLHAKIDALEYVPGPPVAERPARRALLLVTLRDLEEKEEALICVGEAAGMAIARRADADPVVVLGFDPRGSMTEIGGPPGVTAAPRGVVNSVPDAVTAVQASAPSTAPSMMQASASMPRSGALRQLK